MSADTLTSLLNRCTAIIKAKIVTVKALAEDIGEHPVRVSEWVMQRTFEPRGSVAMKLHGWAEKMTIRIAMLDHEIQQRYRREYKKANARFPVNGRN